MFDNDVYTPPECSGEPQSQICRESRFRELENMEIHLPSDICWDF
jgi:hypothetical protein